MVAIQDEQLDLFLEELRRPAVWPQSIQIYKHAENYLHRSEHKWPGMKFTVDCFPNFKACIMGPNLNDSNAIPRRSLRTYNLVANDVAALRRLLEIPGVIDWSKAAYFSAFSSELHDTLKLVCEQHGTTIGPTDRTDFAHVGFLINTKDVQPVPSGKTEQGLERPTTLRPFSAADIPNVNRLWAFSGTPEGMAYLTYLQSHGFPNMAAYGADSEMVGFLICNSEMGLAAAHVSPEHRGRQLFQVMAFEWCKAMAAIGQTDTFAFVANDNIASMKSLTRLGAKKVDDWKVSYVLFRPKNCDPADPLLAWYDVISNKN
ncbi:hypothetical protein BV898_08337 [Hypsibius exemplaris]|uniref:Glycine N-acyltransferase-like protein n=1 Tax=Hypsibius exemplaris TaxID=2072580 RepID=A0A1W0WQT3_HYPEX|nr:hypothetical protein BV898_08337 [Hypsibius exemplaris]